MKPMQWLVVIGLVVGTIMIGASHAVALDWGGTWARKPNTQPNAAPTQQELQQKMQENVVANTNNRIIATTDFLNSCTSKPSCANGYIKSDVECPNELPFSIPSNAYPVKGCYVCNVPAKVASLAPEQHCLAEGYSLAAWNLGTYRCDHISEGAGEGPTKFIQLCPAGTGAENFTEKAYYSKSPGPLYNHYMHAYSYECRFAVSENICNQCGAIAIQSYMENSGGTVYCVLPSNLPPADPNKPCGK